MSRPERLSATKEADGSSGSTWTRRKRRSIEVRPCTDMAIAAQVADDCKYQSSQEQVKQTSHVDSGLEM